MIPASRGRIVAMANNMGFMRISSVRGVVFRQDRPLVATPGEREQVINESR
jgi:hypothetical protein